MSGVAALVAAAGAGQRLGLGPKAFVKVGGRTLLEIAAECFAGTATELVVAVPQELVGRAKRLLPAATVMAGGQDRQTTVRAMLAASSSEIVLVHDVARPFLTDAVLGRVLAAVLEEGAATAALTPPDTVITEADGAALPREQIRLVQTPQGFRRQLLREAHERAAADGFAATDDAGLVRRLGANVAVVEGSPLLAKLTNPADLPVFEGLHVAWKAVLQLEKKLGERRQN